MSKIYKTKDYIAGLEYLNPNGIHIIPEMSEWYDDITGMAFSPSIEYLKDYSYEQSGDDSYVSLIKEDVASIPFDTNLADSIMTNMRDDLIENNITYPKGTLLPIEHKIQQVSLFKELGEMLYDSYTQPQEKKKVLSGSQKRKVKA